MNNGIGNTKTGLLITQTLQNNFQQNILVIFPTRSTKNLVWNILDKQKLYTK